MSEVATREKPLAEKPRRSLTPMHALRRLAESRELTLCVLIIILSVVMAAIYPDNFSTWYNFSAVMLNAAQNGILVTGMMLLMIAGAFDLSIGSILGFAGVVSAACVAWWHLPPEVAVAGGIISGALLGIVNGFIVTRVRINALITTLATMTIYRGLTQLVSGTGIDPIDGGFNLYGQSMLAGLQMPFWVMLVIVLAGWWAVARTRFFRQYYFIGGTLARPGSPESASTGWF